MLQSQRVLLLLLEGSQVEFKIGPAAGKLKYIPTGRPGRQVGRDPS